MRRETRVLNVAEKPSVARSLAAAFLASGNGARNEGERRVVHQIFTAGGVQFPAIQSQGSGREVRAGGPGG